MRCAANSCTKFVLSAQYLCLKCGPGGFAIEKGIPLVSDENFCRFRCIWYVCVRESRGSEGKQTIALTDFFLCLNDPLSVWFGFALRCGIVIYSFDRFVCFPFSFAAARLFSISSLFALCLSLWYVCSALAFAFAFTVVGRELSCFVVLNQYLIDWFL